MRMKTQRAAVQRRMEAKEKEFRWGVLLFHQQQRHSFCSLSLQFLLMVGQAPSCWHQSLHLD
jgi:hypothetical protein